MRRRALDRDPSILGAVQPWVGIPACLDDRGRWRQGSAYLYADLAYARAIEAAGGVPVVLPVQADAAAALARVDALLLPGGDDFPPPEGAYPDTVHFDVAPLAQRRFDAALLEAALARELPVLGICYGAQLLALQHGGSLHYHLPSDVPLASNHQRGDGQHPLIVEPGSRLGAILGEPPEAVNSRHHQAVKDPGAGLRVCAHSQDGVVEAVEGEGPGFSLGVQWHPEKQDNANAHALFGAFIEAAAAASRARAG